MNALSRKQQEDEELDSTFDGISDSDQDSESVDEDSESDDEDDCIKLSEPSENAIYNKDGLLDKLNEIRWPEDVEWIHTLAVEIDQDQDNEVDINDDLARESAIYTQALQGARVGFAKLESRGRPYLRPIDYNAVMIKSDSHMESVKTKLLEEKKELEELEQRKKDKENRTIAKQVQAEKQKEKVKEKKEQIESVKKLRKERERSGFADDKDEMADDKDERGLLVQNETEFDQKSTRPSGVSPGDRSGGKSRKLAEKKKKSSDKKKKEAKFGFGGRKGLKKQNTTDTTSDLKGFNSNAHSGKKRRKLS
ncbi:putative rRNA-processing protein EBP2 homolog [Silene latifolia]|uniref:putative rRNA-processing protein EBP2 homolog n=1 Tax=Silene latifolia TaxID=37657 RepID=UPI003D788E2C